MEIPKEPKGFEEKGIHTTTFHQHFYAKKLIPDHTDFNKEYVYCVETYTV